MSGMSRRNFVKLAGATTAVSAVALTGCDSSSSSSDSDSTSSTSGASYKLGGIGPVTGAAAIYGTAVKNAMTIAVDEVNAAGGAVQFDYKFQDDEHNAEKAVNAYNNLKDWGMQMLIGTVTTAPAIAVSAEANADNMFEITPSASSTDVIGGQPDADGNVTISRKGNVFQMCFTDPNQGTASAKYIKDQNLGSKIGVIYNNSDAYSTGIYAKFAAEAEELGLDIVATTTFTDDTATDFSVQLNTCKSADADLVFLPIYYQPASLILNQAAAMGYDPKWFGVDGMDGILTLEGFDTSLAEGVMLLTPFSADAEDEKTQAFVKAYQDKYGETPNQFAADGYDCVYALVAALEKGECDPSMSFEEICDKLVEVFTDPTFTFDGLTGTTMTWSDTGEVSKDPKGMIIENGVYVGM